MVSFDFDVVVDAPLPRMWAALKDSNKIMPSVLPQIFDSIEYVEGVDGEPGAIRLIKFGSALPKDSYVREKLISVDQDNKIVVAEELEGGHLAIGFSKWVTTLKLTEEGSKTKMSFKFEVEGEGPACAPAIEHSKQGTAPIMQAVAKHVIDHGLYA